MSETCKVTVAAEGLLFNSVKAAEAFTENFSVGTTGSIVPGADKRALTCTLWCMGYDHEERVGSKPTLEDDDFCLVLRLQNEELLDKFKVEGKCIRQTGVTPQTPPQA